MTQYGQRIQGEEQHQGAERQSGWGWQEVEDGNKVKDDKNMEDYNKEDNKVEDKIKVRTG